MKIVDNEWRNIEIVLEWLVARANEGVDVVKKMKEILTMIKENRWKTLDELFGT